MRLHRDRSASDRQAPIVAQISGAITARFRSPPGSALETYSQPPRHRPERQSSRAFELEQRPTADGSSVAVTRKAEGGASRKEGMGIAARPKARQPSDTRRPQSSSTVAGDATRAPERDTTVSSPKEVKEAP